MLQVTRDVTEKMMAEQALRESEERFWLLIDSVTDYAIYMLDVEVRAQLLLSVRHFVLTHDSCHHSL